MVCQCFLSTVFHLSQTPQSFSRSPLLDSVMLTVAGSQLGVLPQSFRPPTLPTKRLHGGETLFTETHNHSLMPVFLIDTEISS